MWRSPAGRKRMVGWAAEGKEARKDLCHRAQMLGDVMTKVRGDLVPVILRRRG